MGTKTVWLPTFYSMSLLCPAVECKLFRFKMTRREYKIIIYIFWVNYPMFCNVIGIRLNNDYQFDNQIKIKQFDYHCHHDNLKCVC